MGIPWHWINGAISLEYDMAMQDPIHYPRYSFRRRLLKGMDHIAFSLLAKRFQIIGKENLPANGKGPLLVIANHFNFADPAAIINTLPWHIEFLAGTDRPTAPNSLVHALPELWGVYNVKRGTGSRYALQAAQAVLQHEGMICVFPEAGAWAQVLRPARPGAPLIAAMSQAPILPIGIDGMTDLFPSLGLGKERATVTVRIGKPFGPFSVDGRGKARRTQLDEIGHEMMRQIAALLPLERRGVYSDDPQLVAEAEKVAAYPW